MLVLPRLNFPTASAESDFALLVFLERTSVVIGLNLPMQEFLFHVCQLLLDHLIHLQMMYHPSVVTLVEDVFILFIIN